MKKKGNTLNDVARQLAETASLASELGQGEAPELDLCDSITYRYDDTIDLYVGLYNLILEVETHDKWAHRKRIRTALEGGEQVFELAWNGIPLDEEKLRLINQRYSEGAESRTQPEHGTRQAAFFIREYGGKVRIENFQGGTYTVRNIVRLPFPSPNP